MRAHAGAHGASVQLRHRAPELDALVDALGPPPSAAPLLRRVKAQFDPAGRLAPGRSGRGFPAAATSAEQGRSTTARHGQTPTAGARVPRQSEPRPWALARTIAGGRPASTTTTRRAGTDRRLRALRLLPADLPDLRPVGRGDGLAARPHLPDEGALEGEPLDDSDRAALRRVPRLHGLRDRLPVGRAVRQADRGDPRADRAQRYARTRPSALFRDADLRALPVPARLPRSAAAAALYQRSGCAACSSARGLLERLPARLQAMERCCRRLDARA